MYSILNLLKNKFVSEKENVTKINFTRFVIEFIKGGIMKETIVKLEEELRHAMIQNDTLKLDELISDSLVFTLPNGQIAYKSDDLDVHSKKLQKISELTYSERIIKTFGQFAVVNVKADIKGDFMGQPLDGSYRYTRIWAKEDELLKIIAGSVTLIA